MRFPVEDKNQVRINLDPLQAKSGNTDEMALKKNSVRDIRKTVYDIYIEGLRQKKFTEASTYKVL